MRKPTDHMRIPLVAAVATLVLVCAPPGSTADRMDNYQIGAHGQADIRYPSWFKESFLDLREDLSDARAANKRGIIVFFSQKNCNHCQAFIDTTLNDPATRQRVQSLYDVIALDIFNDVEITGIDGSVMPIKDFAEVQRARFTPTLLFYGVETAQLVKIVGFYPPEKFDRVLDYIDGDHYKTKSLSQFMGRQEGHEGGMREAVVFDYSLFSRPPHSYDRTQVPGTRPLLVVFERANCGACKRFHERVLSDPEIRSLLSLFDAIQLDSSDDRNRLIIPDGRRISPQQWASELQLAYDISVLFFDNHGNEVHRIDSEGGKDRMAGSMQYVLEKAYDRHEQFLRWRRESASNRRQAN